MSKLTFAAILLAGFTVLSSTALADSAMVGPRYIGDRSANPEQETFAYVVETESHHLLAFVGPARHVGPVTGDAERDTVAYRPLFGVQRDGLWSFRLAGQ